MDYQKLYNQLPKQPIKWTVNDISLWLSFIGLSTLYPKFKELSIDGSCLNSLTEQDLRDQLQIKSGITIKKIMSWINKGLIEYQQFLQTCPVQIQNQVQNDQESKLIDITHKPKKATSMLEQNQDLIRQMSNKSVPEETNAIKPITINHLKAQPLLMEPSKNDTESEMLDQNEEDKKKEFELIIQQCDGPQTSFFSVKEEGAKIGRHSSNNILILDESISRFHAEIKFHQGVFFIRDTGSTTGTFLKISDKIEIQAEMIIEMGSNQFQALLQPNSLHLQIIQGPSQGTVIEVPRQTKSSIGRKQSNMHSFDDQHLSNVHATFCYQDGKYYIEDMGTTNGSWHRLSFEGETSELYELHDKTIFKIGSSQTYCCKIKMVYVSQKTNPNACIICYENDKDCVYMPCKHNTACIRCSKSLKECPICRIKIDDYVRIYKH